MAPLARTALPEGETNGPVLYAAGPWAAIIEAKAQDVAYLTLQQADALLAPPEPVPAVTDPPDAEPVLAVTEATTVRAPNRLKRPTPNTPERIALSEAQRAKAQDISHEDPADLVSALAALPADHPAERVRSRLGKSWDELLMPAAPETTKNARCMRRKTKSRWASRPHNGRTAKPLPANHLALTEARTVYPTTVREPGRSHRDQWALKSGINNRKINGQSDGGVGDRIVFSL